jgi:citrate lyase beta subunit
MESAFSEAAWAETLTKLPTSEATSLGAAARDRRTAPSHVVYGGAHLFGTQTIDKLEQIARAGFETYLPDSDALAAVFGVAPAHAEEIHRRVDAQLRRQPVADCRIDFEDGYGPRSDEEEDAHASAAGEAVAALAATGRLGDRLIGVRCKRLAGASGLRAVRTLHRFFDAAKVPVRVTVPKVESVDEAAAASALLAALEHAYGLPEHGCVLELMAETPAFFSEGIPKLHAITAAAGVRGRPVAVHLGSYDLTAGAGIPFVAQRPDHPILDHARTLLALAFGGHDVELSDGATTTLPIAPHKQPNSDDERVQNAQVVTAAFRQHASDVAHALRFGIYESWVLHPMQLVSHRVAQTRFFVEALPGARSRLSRFLEGEARASRVGAEFDDAATGRGLLQFFVRAAALGIVDDDDPLLEETRRRFGVASGRGGLT